MFSVSFELEFFEDDAPLTAATAAARALLLKKFAMVTESIEAVNDAWDENRVMLSRSARVTYQFYASFEILIIIKNVQARRTSQCVHQMHNGYLLAESEVLL